MPSYQELEDRVNALTNADHLRSEMEAALRVSEEKYRTLTENITVGIFRSTPGPRGTFIEANAALVRMLGYEDKEELFANEVAAIYQNPADRLEFSEKISRDGFVKHEELMLRQKNGAPILVSETAIAVRDAQGMILYFDGIIEDITERKKAEEELLLQKTYLERLFNSAPEAIVLHDNNDCIVNVNDEFTRMFGYSRDEAVGRPINDLVASEAFQDEAVSVSAQVLRGERVELDTKRKRKDGSLIDVSILGAPIVHNGRQIGDYAIYRDITDRKRAVEELRLQKTYLEQLFNSAPEAIVLHDNDDRVVNVNEEFIRMFGYTRQEAIGKPINQLVAPAQLMDEASILSDKVTHGERVERDSKRRRKDGALIDVSILGAPILHEGKQLGVYAIYRDITGRKKSEEELRVQKTYLERLFNSAPEAIVLHDNNDRVVNINEEFTRMFGHSREEAIGRTINELVAPDDLRDEASVISHSVRRGERIEIDSQRKRKDGTLIDVSILGAPIVHGGRQMGVYAIYRDITERKKAEEARIRLREEARMARNIQMNFLPDADPVMAGYDIAGKSEPAMNVGGDYYDFIRLDEHRLALCLGDVSGNGLAASLVMANLQATIRGQAMFDADPAACLERANTLLFRSTDSRTFISLFYGVLDCRTNVLSYANAGQDQPILFSPGSDPVPLTTRGMALGMKEHVVYRKEAIALNPGSRLLIHSDGIPEAMNASMEDFSEQRLIEIVRQNRDDAAGQLIGKIIAAARQHVGTGSETDDMTAILIRRV